jgi:hypothetical protein
MLPRWLSKGKKVCKEDAKMISGIILTTIALLLEAFFGKRR